MFPLVSRAAGTYYACPKSSPYANPKDGQCYQGITKDGVYTGFPAVAPEVVCYDGFVPCGKEVWYGTMGPGGKCQGTLSEKPLQCQLCHFFVMIDGMIDYLLVKIIPPVAVLMIVIMGVMYYFGGAKPELLSRSKTVIKTIIIGLALIYGAYMIIGIFLSVLGASKVEQVKDIFDKGVFSVNCPIDGPIQKNP